MILEDAHITSAYISLVKTQSHIHTELPKRLEMWSCAEEPRAQLNHGEFSPKKGREDGYWEQPVVSVIGLMYILESKWKFYS